MGDKLRIYFNNINYGWAGIKFERGDIKFEEMISHTPTDIFWSLCQALCAILDEFDADVIEVYAGPVEYDLRFVIVDGGQSVACALDRWPSHAERSAVVQPHRPFFAQGKTDEIVLPFWRALRRLEASMTPFHYADMWRRPFPTYELAELTKRVRTLKTRQRNAFQ